MGAARPPAAVEHGSRPVPAAAASRQPPPSPSPPPPPPLHQGHFYLAQLLLPAMAPKGRVIVTSSGTHDPAVKAPLPEPKFDRPSEMAMLK
jgi:NAD(P)-dependent dehydrogenase (short-subunit alcohol dehydrogenase family)